MSCPSTSSGLKSSSTAIHARSAVLTSLICEGDGTNVATIIVYDNASAASGTIVAKAIVPAGARTVHLTFDAPIVASNGLYLSVSGTGAGAIVHYQITD